MVFMTDSHLYIGRTIAIGKVCLKLLLILALIAAQITKLIFENQVEEVADGINTLSVA